MIGIDDRPAAPTALDPNAPDARYGGNTVSQRETPEWVAWNTNQINLKQKIQTLRSSMGAVPGPLRGQVEADIARLEAELATNYQNEPERYPPTALGADVQNVRDIGAVGRDAIRTAGANIVDTGTQVFDQGQVVWGANDRKAGAAQGREAPTVAPTSGVERIRGATTAGAAAITRAAAAPAGPSAAEAQLRMQADKDKRAALAIARSARGGPGAVASALRRAQAENAATTAETRGQMGILRAQEEATRRGEIIGAATSAAQLGVTGETAAAGVETDIAKTNVASELQMVGLNDEQTRFFSGLGEEARQAGINARLEAQKTGLSAEEAAARVGLEYAQLAWQMLTTEQQAELTRMGIEAGVINANEQNARAKEQQTLQFLGTALMAGGAAASDRRTKTAIRKLRSIAADLRATPASEWEYKEPARHGKGRHSGPMAQDLEKTRTFRGAVREVNGVKMVDGTRLALAQHGALHDLQRQVDRLSKVVERKRGADKSPEKRA